MTSDESTPAATTAGDGRALLWLAVIGAVAVLAFVAGFLALRAMPLRYAGRDRHTLREVGLAAIQYGSWPDAGRPFAQHLAPQARLSWIARILPQLERRDLYEVLDFDKPWDAPENRRLTQVELRCVECQTDPCPPGHTNIVGIGGLGSDSPTLPPDHPRAGYFGYGRIAAPGDVKDGASYTLMIAATDRTGPWAQGGAATVRPLDPADPPYIGQDAQFGRVDGAIVAFADDHVRPIDASIDAKVLEALSTINGGEQVPPF